MEVKINREIRNDTESMLFGLSLRQFVFSLLALGFRFCCDFGSVMVEYIRNLFSVNCERKQYKIHYHERSVSVWLIVSSLKTLKKSEPMVNRHGKEVRVRFYPKGFEYSVKDDKIRILATGCKFKQFNLGRVVSCDFYNGSGPWHEKPKAERRKNLTLLITD